MGRSRENDALLHGASRLVFPTATTASHGMKSEKRERGSGGEGPTPPEPSRKLRNGSASGSGRSLSESSLRFSAAESERARKTWAVRQPAGQRKLHARCADTRSESIRPAERRRGSKYLPMCRH